MRYIFTLLLGLLMFNINAQNEDTIPHSDLDLERLLKTKIISAGKQGQNISDAPANVIIISDHEIERRGYLTLEDVLKDLPGFDFNGSQPAGEYPSHFLFRGIGDVGQTKFVIMIDGIAQNDISNGWVRNIGYNFSLIDVDRIEFISGPGSALYGANAYAGYINIITKNRSNEDSLQVRTTLLGGTYSTYSPEIILAGNLADKLNFQVSGRYFSSQGDMGLNRLDPGNYFHNNFEPDSVFTEEYGMIANEVGPDSLTNPINDGFNTSVDDYYIRGKLYDDKFSLRFNFWKKNEGLGSEIVGYEYFANTPGIDYQVVHSGKSLDLKYQYDLGKNLNAYSMMYYRNTSVLPETGFTYTYQYQSVNNGIQSPVLNKKKKYHSEGFLFGFEQQFNFQLSDKNRLIMGGQIEQKIREYFNISIDDNQISGVKSNLPGQNLIVQPVYFSKNGGVFLQDAQQLNEDFEITLGLRYDLDEFFGNVFNPRLAAVYSPGKNLSLKALYGQGFKAPTIFELYDEWRGSDRLLPEKIKTSEFIAQYISPKWGIASIGGFYSYMDNLIVVAKNPDTSDVKIGALGQYTNYYQNIGTSAIYGANASFQLKLANSISVFFNYQYLANLEGNIDNVSSNKVNVGFNYLFKDKVNINLRANYVNQIKAPLTNKYFHPKTNSSISEIGYDYVTIDNPTGYMPGHFVINGAITGNNLIEGKNWQLKPQIIIKNVLNTQYAQIGRQSGDGVRPVNSIQSSIINPAGFIPAYHPQAGREIYLSLRFEFN